MLLLACVQRACYSMSINLRSHHRILASGATVLSLSAIVTSVMQVPYLYYDSCVLSSWFFQRKPYLEGWLSGAKSEMLTLEPSQRANGNTRGPHQKVSRAMRRMPSRGDVMTRAH